MKKSIFKKKDKGLTASITIVIFAAAAIVLLSSLYLYEAALMDFPSNIAIHQQFNDIGNGISTELTAAVISLPAHGRIEFDEALPAKIGGYEFETNILIDQIQIKSDKGFHINYTISGMDKEFNINETIDKGYGGRIKSIQFDLHR